MALALCMCGLRTAGRAPASFNTCTLLMISQHKLGYPSFDDFSRDIPKLNKNRWIIQGYTRIKQKEMEYPWISRLVTYPGQVRLY